MGLLTTVRQRFMDLKTLTKLLVGIMLVAVVIAAVGYLGVVGLQQLKGTLQAVYDDSTQTLADLASSGSSLGLYHDAILEAGRARTKVEFDIAIKPLAVRKAGALDPVKRLAGTPLGKARSGRDQGKDVKALGDALQAYFKSTEGVLSTLQDSMDPKNAEEQRELFRSLGQLSIATDVARDYTKTAEKFKEAVTSAREVAKDLNEAGQTTAAKQITYLIGGALAAIFIGVAFVYYVALIIAKGVSHIADVAMQAASGKLQARATLQSHDELGQMAQAFNTMLDRITGLVQSEEERNLMQNRTMQFLAFACRATFVSASNVMR